MTWRIITWTLKLLDTECYTAIAGRGIAILISLLGTAGLVDCFNRVFEKYIDLFQFLLVGYRLPLAMPLTCLSHSYFSSLSTSTHEANLLDVTKNNLRSSGLLFMVQTFIILYQKK